MSPSNEKKQQQNTDRLQNEIQNHFEKEIEIKKKMLELDENIDNISQQILKSYTENSKNNERIEILKENQANCQQKYDQLLEDYNVLLSKRMAIWNVNEKYIISNLVRMLKKKKIVF